VAPPLLDPEREKQEAKIGLNQSSLALGGKKTESGSNYEK